MIYSVSLTGLNISWHILWSVSHLMYNVSSVGKGVIRSRKSKEKQYNGKKKENKKTNNYPQNNTQKTKDWAERTLLKSGGEIMFTTKLVLYNMYARPLRKHCTLSDWVRLFYRSPIKNTCTKFTDKCLNTDCFYKLQQGRSLKYYDSQESINWQ
jgi:hypothetical protein